MSFQCDVCLVSLNSPQQYQQHLEGQNHAKKLRLQKQNNMYRDDQSQGGVPNDRPLGRGKWRQGQFEGNQPGGGGQGRGSMGRGNWPPQGQGRGGGGRGQDGSWGQGQSQQGRGRGRAIRGSGGRGRGGSFGAGGGQNLPLNFTPQQLFGQLQTTQVSETQVQQNAMQLSAALPGLEPSVMNALSITAAALQSANMGSLGNQANTLGNSPMFGNLQNRGSSAPRSDFNFGSGPSFQTRQNQFSNSSQLYGNNDFQEFGNNPSFGNNLSFGNEERFGNNQSFAFGNNQTFGNNSQAFSSNNPMFTNPNQAFESGNQRFGGGNTFGGGPGGRQPFLTPDMFKTKGEYWRAMKAQKAQNKPKVPPPLPKPKRVQPDLKQPLVFGDNMGVVSVSMEGEDELYCQICCVNMTSAEQAYLHYRGAKHLKKARIARLKEVGALTEDNESTPVGEFYCSDCQITVNSADQLKVHKDGAKHKKMMQQRKRKPEGSAEAEPCEKKPSPDVQEMQSGYKSFVAGGAL